MEANFFLSEVQETPFRLTEFLTCDSVCCEHLGASFARAVGPTCPHREGGPVCLRRRFSPQSARGRERGRVCARALCPRSGPAGEEDAAAAAAEAAVGGTRARPSSLGVMPGVPSASPFPAGPDPEERYDFLFKLVLIGDASVGKTCLVQRFKTGAFAERQGNTIGVDFIMKSLEIQGKRVKVCVRAQ
nr:PREDICTED: ras-related protein Rab-26-like [Anolis carolinensis]|eukprot:XP_008116544.1 PREDICTED: ras-related protein Rab-26-like [Anolis carolinensis]